MNENNNSKSKNKRKLIIAIIVMVCVLVLSVVGVSYAFYTLQTSGETTTKIMITAGEANNITLSGKIENFRLNINTDDMAYNNLEDYYATTESEKSHADDKEDGTKNLGTININGTEVEPQTCKATIKLESKDIETIQKDDLTLGIIYDGKEEEIDLKNFPSDGKTIEFELYGDVNPAYIKAYLKFNNDNRDQSYLANKNMSIKVSIPNFECEASKALPPLEMLDKKGGQYYARGKTGEEKVLVDELYRFRGTASKVNNNFICLGPTEEDTCEDAENMYRIIGATEEGQLKVIKAKNIGAKQWHSDDTIEVKWNESDLYKELNSTFYNSINERIKVLIEDHTWNMEVNMEVGDSYPWPPSNPTSESISEGTATGYIGLMYATDYVNAGVTNYKNWLNVTNGITGSRDYDEWTMSRLGFRGCSEVWFIYRSKLRWERTNIGHSYVRPVFYLSSDILLFGKGTEDIPYRIVN